ncbi:MAG: hypothetical protein IKZ84_16670 [Victivallales bacterium]|nr:hypothetical protein [Victivallales bacterium]
MGGGCPIGVSPLGGGCPIGVSPLGAELPTLNYKGLLQNHATALFCISANTFSHRR